MFNVEYIANGHAVDKDAEEGGSETHESLADAVRSVQYLCLGVRLDGFHTIRGFAQDAESGAILYEEVWKRRKDGRYAGVAFARDESGE